MRSMTGYGRATAQLGGRALTVQVSSVNRRSLDLSVTLPPEWEGLEPAATEAVRGAAARGKVHVDIEVARAAGANGGFDEAAIGETLTRLAALAQARRIPFQPTPELLWQIATAEQASASVPPLDAARETVLAALAAALGDFVRMREREGQALLADFTARTASLRSHVDVIAQRAPLVTSQYRDVLHRRLREADLTLDLSDERVLKEIALFADRCDISEELTRFRSHLDQFVQTLAAEGEVGRKAEFILQEMGREAHTMGSKANDLTIARAVIELKNELERIKEQMANVE